MPVSIPQPASVGQLITDTDWNGLVEALSFLLTLKFGQSDLADLPNFLNIGLSVGDIKISYRTSDEGITWLRCDGRTIGSSSSGADIADDNLENLFKHLWTETDSSIITILNSNGTPSTKGADADSDWLANKRIALPDLRGRTVIGVDDPTGSNAANTITDANADVLGGSLGSETHILTVDELAAHSHRIADVNSTIGGGENPYGPKMETFTSRNGNAIVFRQIIANNGPYTVDIIEKTGGGQGHNNVQPSTALNYFIFSQA